jgi:hypothetical protein
METVVSARKRTEGQWRLSRTETPNSERREQAEESIPFLSLIVTVALTTFSVTRPTTRAYGSGNQESIFDLSLDDLLQLSDRMCVIGPLQRQRFALRTLPVFYDRL